MRPPPTELRLPSALALILPRMGSRALLLGELAAMAPDVLEETVRSEIERAVAWGRVEAVGDHGHAAAGQTRRYRRTAAPLPPIRGRVWTRAGGLHQQAAILLRRGTRGRS